MMTHLAKIEGMVGQLKDLGSPIDDHQVISKVLMTLPPKYGKFRESWGLLPAVEKNKTNLISKFLLSEFMLEHRTRTQERDVALIAKNQDQGVAFMSSSSNAGSSGMLCSNCGLNNHICANCRRLKRKYPNDSKSSKKTRVKCTFCHYQNHEYEDCRIRKRHEAALL